MSALINAVATATASPTPSPQIIHEFTKVVAVTPPAVLQLAQILAVAAAGVATSILHSLVERGKLSGNVNRFLFTLYSVIAGVVVMKLTGQLKVDSNGILTGLTAALAYLGSTQGQKFVTDLLTSLKVENAPDGSVVPVASPTEAGV